MIRITEVLSYFSEPWLVDWKLRTGKAEANRIGKASMRIGSRVDEVIKSCCPILNQTYIYSLPSKEKDEVRQCLEAFNKWMNVYKPKEVISGTRLYATIEGQEVTGEPDIFVDGVLVDIKCASKISPSYWVQVNMYEYLNFMSKFPDGTIYFPRKVGILRLDKTTGSYEYVVKEFDRKLCDVWCGLMRAMVYFKGDNHVGCELPEVGEV